MLRVSNSDSKKVDLYKNLSSGYHLLERKNFDINTNNWTRFIILYFEENIEV